MDNNLINKNKSRLYAASALLLGLAFIFDNIFKGPKILIETKVAYLIVADFLILFLALSLWTVVSFWKKFAAAGPYEIIDYPFHSAIVLFLIPAVAFYFKSWLIIFASVAIFFIWQNYLRKKRSAFELKGALLPHFGKNQKIVYYALIGVISFFLVSIFISYDNFSKNWIAFEKGGKIQYDEVIKVTKKSPTPVASFSIGENNSVAANTPLPANYTTEPNSIKISKIGVNAPLVFAAGTTQQQLNDALNKGVIIYPGSVLPGQNGELFLSGHSSTYSWNKTLYGKIFSTLNNLVVGDIISVVYDNLQYDYRITNKKIMPAVEVKIGDGATPIIRLMTCWPIGTSDKRLVVEGELIK